MNEIPWKTRWSADEIKSLLVEQFENFEKADPGTPREILNDIQKAARLPHAVIISGLRRVGKSTLLCQIAHMLGKQSFYYLNFEDDRFINFGAEDINDLFQIMAEVYGERRIFLIDEIQNIPGWEHFVRRFMEQGYKFYITGSNASLLSRELGSRLTGRYIPMELFPFSFKEYLLFKGKPLPDLDHQKTLDKARINALLGEFLLAGGIPDALKYPELPLLRSLYEDVLYRDIAARYHLEAVTALRELAYYFLSNPAGKVAYNKLKTQFGLGSVNTISSYIEYLQNSWLIFTVNLYAYSLKSQQLAPKKIYCIDTGMSREVGFHFSPDTGKLYENLAYLALRRQTGQIHYLTTPNGYEVDFYLPEQRRCIQVAQHLDNPAVRERELRALEDAMKTMPVESALILANTNHDDIKVGNNTVQVKSMAEWLVDQ